MDEFEKLLCSCKNAVERFVRYKIYSQADAEDILQDIFLTAFKSFTSLNDKLLFKAWIISIARNKCNDYFRSKAKLLEIPLDAIMETKLCYGRFGIAEMDSVRETFDLLSDKDRQILSLYFFRELPQSEIVKRLHIPLGTVKSRLHTAKRNFREKYPYPPQKSKGDIIMKKLPKLMPSYTIMKSDKEPFSVKWEELMGWFIVPKLGEKLSWGLYDGVSRKQTEFTTMEVVGKAEVHGIEGVEIVANQHNVEDYYRTGCEKEMERRFVAQLTETHCRYLAESHMNNGIRKCYTFLDGESFLRNWGYGEDNCGNKINLTPKHILQRDGSNITGEEIIDIVGRYTVTINEKVYDTICVVDINTYDDAIGTESYLDKNGRTILWRRFNRDDWARDRFQKNWSKQLPDNERLIINGETYVHWYDCITDYIL